jgi:hypothetical protein
MNKTFTVVSKTGKIQRVVIRQMEHDPQYTVGSRIPSYGRVIAVAEQPEFIPFDWQPAPQWTKEAKERDADESDGRNYASECWEGK